MGFKVYSYNTYRYYIAMNVSLSTMQIKTKSLKQKKSIKSFHLSRGITGGKLFTAQLVQRSVFHRFLIFISTQTHRESRKEYFYDQNFIYERMEINKITTSKNICEAIQ